MTCHLTSILLHVELDKFVRMRIMEIGCGGFNWAHLGPVKCVVNMLMNKKRQFLGQLSNYYISKKSTYSVRLT